VEGLAFWCVFSLDRSRCDAFVAAFEATPRRHPRLERLFNEPSVFDSTDRS
jgi:uncharacterized protein (DUF1778 family)